MKLRPVRNRFASRTPRLLPLFLLLLAGPAIGPALAGPPQEKKEIPPAATGEVDFAKQIHPILEKNCVRCHGPKKQESNFRLDSREAALKGGDLGKDGSDIIIGKSAESRLIHLVAVLDEDKKMPPTGKPLTAEQVGLMRAWIDQGLKWPEVVAEVKEVVKPQERATLKGHSGPVTALALSRDGTKLASAGGQSLLFRPGEVKLWDVGAGGNLGPEGAKTAFEGHASMVWCVAFSPDGATLATGSYDKVVKLWEVATGKEKATLQGHANWVTCVAFSPDGTTVATGSEDTTVKLWDVASGKEKGTVKGHAGTVRCVVFSPDGKLLATASFDKTVKLWTLTPGEGGALQAAEKATLQGHTDWVWSLSFSADGKSLATAGSDGIAKVWSIPADGDATAPQEKASLKGHSNWITSVAFSPDARRLATASYDKTVKVWDVGAQADIETFRGHEGTVWSVAFTPDGKEILSGSQDGSVKVWDVPPPMKVRKF